MLKLLSLVLLSGCATLGTFQNAETLGKGGWEVGIEPSMWGGAGAGGAVTYPHAGVSARVGVSDRVDIGGRIGSTGVEFTTKFGLTARDAAVPISFAPTVGGFAIAVSGASAGILALHLPVLIGLRVGDRGEFVLGPKAHIYQIFANSGSLGGSATIWSLGGSAGYSAPVGKTVKLIPEVACVVPVVGTASASGSSVSAFGSSGVLFQVGMGIVIGSKQ